LLAFVHIFTRRNGIKNIFEYHQHVVFSCNIFLTLHIASSEWLLLKSKVIFQTGCFKMLMCLRSKFHMPSAIRSSVRENAHTVVVLLWYIVKRKRKAAYDWKFGLLFHFTAVNYVSSGGLTLYKFAYSTCCYYWM